MNKSSKNDHYFDTYEKVVAEVLLKSLDFIIWDAWVYNSLIKVIRYLVQAIASPVDLVPNKLSLALTLLVDFELNLLPL